MVLLKQLLPLTLLYTLEGITIALATMSVPNELRDKNIPFQEYTFTRVLLIVYLFRVIFAPISDCLQRKYLLPGCLFAFALVCYFNNYNDVDAVQMFYTQLSLVSLMALIDTILGAWASTHLGHGALAQYVGWIVGAFIGSFGFAMFNSVTFCNLYINAIPSDIPLITLTNAYHMLAYSAVGLAIYTYMTQIIEEHNVPIVDIYTTLLNFYGNKNILTLAGFLIAFRIGLMPIDLAHVYLLSRHFTTGQVQFMQTLAFPIACLLPVYMAKLVKERRFEIRYIIIFSYYKIFTSVLFMIMLYWYECSWDIKYRDLLLKVSLIAGWMFNIVNLALAHSYIYKITRTCIPTTYVALLTSFIMATFLIEGIVESIIPHVNFYVLWLAGVGCFVAFMTYSQIIKVDQLESIEFCLEIDIKKERLIVTTELTEF